MSTLDSNTYWKQAKDSSESRSIINEEIRKNCSEVNIVKWVAFTVTATQEEIRNFLQEIWK